MNTKLQLFISFIIIIVLLSLISTFPVASTITINSVDVSESYQVEGDLNNMNFHVSNFNLKMNNINTLSEQINVNVEVFNERTEETITHKREYESTQNGDINDEFSINLVGDEKFNINDFPEGENTDITIDISIDHPDVQKDTVKKSISIMHFAPKSCSDILDSNPEAESGDYKIYPTSKDSVTVKCDMDTDGGGWTGFDTSSAREMIEVSNDGGLDVFGSIRESGYYDNTDRPYYVNNDDGGARYDIPLSFNFDEFYTKDVSFRPTAYIVSDHTSEYRQHSPNYVMSEWSETMGGGCDGDIGFGTPAQSGPVISYAQAGESFEAAGDGSNIVAGNPDYYVTTSSYTTSIFYYNIDEERGDTWDVTTDDMFRMQFTENCGQNEGWMWFEGEFFAR